MLPVRRPATRFAVSHWLIAAAVAAAGVFIQSRSPSLVDPPSCPGILEWLSVAAAGSSSRLPLASFITSMNLAGAVFALVALTRWIAYAAGTLPAAIAMSFAAAFTLVPDPTLAPADVIAVGAAASGWLGIVHALDSHRLRHIILAGVGLVATAAIAPPIAIPLAAATAWVTWSVSAGSSLAVRIFRAAVMAAIVIIVPAAVITTFPQLPGGQQITATSCLVPGSGSAAVIRESLTRALSSTGPVPIVLALLAAFGLRHTFRQSSTWPLVAVAIVPMLAAAWSTSTAVRTLAPAIAALWWMAAAGFREVTNALVDRASWRAGTWALVVLLPALQWSHRSAQPVAPADQPRGHELLTRRDVSQLFATLPSLTSIVVDDAVTDLLFRSAADTARQSGKMFRMIPRNGREAARAAANGPVHAMPRAQFDLQHHGLRRAEVVDAVMPGMIAFEMAGACAVVELRWQETTAPANSTRIAVVASHADARGPVLIYLGSSVALSPHPLDWPTWALRGYYADTYDFGREADRQRFDRDTIEDLPPRSAGVFKFPHITRLELWRVPNGPAALALGLNNRPEIALLRGSTAADGVNLDVCPSFPVEIGSLAPARR